MKRQAIFATLTAIAVTLSAPALAKPGGGGGGGGGAGAAGGMGDSMRDLGRMNSRALDNADQRAIDRANENSVLRGDSSGVGTARARAGSRIPESSAQLVGVTEGMTVVDGDGVTVGTVTDVNTRGNGAVRNIQLTLTDGSTVTVKAKDLSVDGGVLTTATIEGQAANRRVNSQGAANANVQGLINANERSVLASAGVTTLTGLATGLTVNTSGGTSIGTVSQIVTNRSGAVVGVNVALAGGGTVFVPATTLSMDGTTVITSSTQF